MVVVGWGRGGGIVAIVIACFHRDDKSECRNSGMKGTYSYVGNPCDRQFCLSIEKLGKGNCMPGHKWKEPGICPDCPDRRKWLPNNKMGNRDLHLES
jgi:hypothetical protein